MLCDARELADEIDIPSNFELTQPRHTVRRRNVIFDYKARNDPTEDPTLKYKAEFIFFTLDKSINAFESSSARGLLAMDHVILNHGQVTWTTPELAPPLLTTTPHQRGGRFSSRQI
ncbi:uncharacterized protein TNCV_3483101 [Trichonephila clavipes]|nr:uncharacterized protein TNCV_3483101 [Trichonephila clavipes]